MLIFLKINGSMIVFFHNMVITDTGYKAGSARYDILGEENKYLVYTVINSGSGPYLYAVTDARNERKMSVNGGGR